MSDTLPNEFEPSNSRFLSLKWKSATTFLTVVLALLALLVWYFFEEFNRDYSAKLSDLRLQQIEQLEKSVYQSADQLYNLVNSTILNNYSQQKVELKNYQQRIENIFPNLQSSWKLDEAVMIDSKGAVNYHHQTPYAGSNFLIPWIASQNENQTNLLTSTSTINIICSNGCRQVILVPLMDNNTRAATVAISRDLFDLQQAHLQQSQTNVLLLRKNSALDSGFVSNPETEIAQWNGTVVSDKYDSSTLKILQDASEQFSISDLLGISKPFAINDKYYALNLLPVRGYEDLSLHYVLFQDFTLIHQALVQNLIQEITVVACLFAIFTLYIFFLNWRYIKRVKQQIKVLPLLGQNEFNDARDIVNKNRSHNVFRDELDVLDDSVTNLSYQLESLENTVSVRTREMERLSLFDTLTGLANRNLLQYELESDVLRYEQEGGVLAVVLLDLDKFKRINDSISHQQGDEILGKIASRLKSATKSLGLVARLGGDEFAIILRSAKNYQQIESLCKKILELVHRPLEIDDHSIAISCSLGVALAAKGSSSDDMIKNAEIAMYKAKDTGGNAYRLFDSFMAAEAQTNLSLEAEIRRAFENREFTLFLQPKVNMDANIEGFESLIRWDHPDRGLVPPGEFIAPMENMGLISQLDNFVLDSSCRQLQVLQTHYPEVSIAVNISSTHFTDKNFLVFLKQCLAKYAINPSLLELEITETLLMENMSVGLEIIEQIKALGVRIAIDDFGTGYSSLSYLKKLPVDSIKIDREFIKDIPESESDMQISSVIIFLAKQLDFTVIAEGVETSEQLVFLKANQCDLAQGFLFSKPIPAHKAMLLLESQLGGDKLSYG